MNKLITLTVISGIAVLLSACGPKVGSEKWCAAMKEKPKGEWTANEAGDYTKYCILNMEKEPDKKEPENKEPEKKD